MVQRSLLAVRIVRLLHRPVLRDARKHPSRAEYSSGTRNQVWTVAELGESLEKKFVTTPLFVLVFKIMIGFTCAQPESTLR